MSNDGALLEVRELVTAFALPDGESRALDGVAFDVRPGEVVGLVGESGSGKTLTALSILGLVDYPGRVVAGSIRLQREELLVKSEREMRQVRGKRIAMIWQDPMASLNPVKRIGTQIEEVLRLHSRERVARRAMNAQVVSALEAVHAPDASRLTREYPHQLSGGLLQRAMIAMALISRPALLIADEPTTALDVTIQLQILELLRELQRTQGMSILLITHDLGVVAETCEQVQVMYAGRIVESADTDSLFRVPSHPYTTDLLASVPRRETRKGELKAIQGAVPDVGKRPAGCAFHPRCQHAEDRCRRNPAPTMSDGSDRAACWFADRLAKVKEPA